MDCDRLRLEAVIPAGARLRDARLLAVIGVLLWSVACGSFENSHFYEGEGEVVGLTTPGASVFVVGQPHLATSADGTGAFVISELPAGLQALITNANGKSRLRELRAVAGQRAELGQITPDQQGRVVGSASPDALVFLPGTDFATRVGDDGSYQLEGLPEACLELVIAGQGAGEACVRDGGEVVLDLDSLDVPGRLECEEREACAGDQICRGGFCVAAECSLSAQCPAAYRCEAGRCVPGACACGPDTSQLCGDGLECFDGCHCRPSGCVVKGPEQCDGLDDDCDGEVDEDLEPKTPCGLPSMCGAGELICMGSQGFRCESAPEELECRGLGPTLVVYDLRVSEGSGLDLDDADGDGDFLTGVDNRLGLMRPLAELLETELRRGLRMPGGIIGAYLLELAGLAQEGTASGDEVAPSLRLFVGYPELDGLGYMVASGLEGEHLQGQLPLRLADDGGLLAGPSNLELRLSPRAASGGLSPDPACADEEDEEADEREIEACVDDCLEEGGDEERCRRRCEDQDALDDEDCRREGRGPPGPGPRAAPGLPLGLVWATVAPGWKRAEEVEVRVGAAIGLEALLGLIHDREWRRSVELLISGALDVDTDRDGVLDSISLGFDLHAYAGKQIVGFKSGEGN